MYRHSLQLALAAFYFHLFFNSASCTVDICSSLTCESDLTPSRSPNERTEPDLPTSPSPIERLESDLASSNEPSESGSAVPLYILDVEKLENYTAVTLRMTGSWHYTDPGPAGYMLDVFEEGNPEITIGKFADPHPRSTAKACSDGKTIMFKSCQPTVLDLPRTYQWTANKNVNGTVCFRATIQSIGNQSCQTLVECRYLNLSQIQIQEEEPTPTIPSLVVSNVTPSPKQVAKCHKKHDCTQATLKDFCCSDGNTYASRCHKRVTECIHKISLTCHKGACKTTPKPVEEGVCARDRDMYRQRYQWNVMCDCYGHFKPIQCHKDICVCVNKMGDQEGDPVTFTGSDELNLRCF